METQNIQITQSDFDKLQALLRNFPITRPEDKATREALSKELERAEIRSSDDIPPDVITLNSCARLRNLKTGDILELTIVLPDQVDLNKGHISILAPLGTAMLGYRKGDIFEWTLPGGLSRFLVEKILFQPEAVEKAERDDQA